MTRGPDRTKRPCRCKYARHRHGHYRAYIADRCRCDPCTDAFVRHKKREALSDGFVDPQPVVDHVRALLAGGMTQRQIADLAGWTPDGLSDLLSRPVRQRMESDSARALLGVTLQPHPQAIVDPTGSERRLQALFATGWNLRALARYTGLAWQTLDHVFQCRNKHGVTVAVRDAIADAYEQLWDQPPPLDTPAQRRAASASRNRAQRNGWPPPAAWDNIDDPDEKPTGWAKNKRDTAQDDRWHDIVFFRSIGVTDHEIAERLGIQPASLARLTGRHAA